MSNIDGNSILANALRREGVDTLFYLMGGPTLGAAQACIDAGISMIDTRHEQAAAMMAQAYARLRARPGVCMAASGPGTINLSTGLANALIDCAPVLAIGGSSPVSQYGTGAFQEIDQLAIMRPLTKWSERVYDAKRIPEFVSQALNAACSGKPGPVYLDIPGDILYQQVEEGRVVHPPPCLDKKPEGPAATEGQLNEFMALLETSERPVVLTGSGIIWSKASAQLRNVLEHTGIPFYTTPQGRGALPDDHELSFPAARSLAFREADLVIVVGTRLNYVNSFGAPPRFSPDSRIVRIDISAEEVAQTPRLALGMCCDASAALEQIASRVAGKSLKSRFLGWRERLSAEVEARRPRQELAMNSDASPIHPLRLCKEVRDLITRDTILAVDGQEILNFGRQSIPTFQLGHRLNSGPFGTMGVGLPFGVGAKAACRDKPVVVLHGDGSFGFNALELDTAVRHKLPMLVVISLNGGWTADPEREKPGRDLGYTRYDELARSLGCYAEYVEKAEDIAAALQRGWDAMNAGKVALINVVTDWRARATTTQFTNYST